MAIGWREKQELENKILNFIMDSLKEKDEITCTNKSLRQGLELNYHPATVTSALANIEYELSRKHIIYRCQPIDRVNTYSYVKASNVLTDKIEKRKNLLCFFTVEDEMITYDFITKEWSTPFEKLYTKEMNLQRVFDLLNYEWLFNYLDLENLDYRTIANLAYAIRDNAKMMEKCPKGLASYLNETNERFSAEIIKKLYMMEKYGYVGMNIAKEIGIDNLDKLMEYGVVKNYHNVIITTVKKGLFNINSYRESYSELADKFISILNLDNSYRLDENKSIKDNIKMIDNVIDSQKDTLLAKQLQKLNFINGLTIDGLTVVVPQSQAEKKAEGEMQHNCVGYYYDQSIIKGQNLIYFIRKTDNPTKSYITCRFNTLADETVEYRGFSNRSVADDNAIKFIEVIDEVIRKNLK